MSDILKLTAADLSADWWRRTQIPAAERTHRPPAPKVATHLRKPLDGGWIRDRISEGQALDLRNQGVPVLDSWQSLHLTSGLYDGGVVVMDMRQ